MENKRKVQSEEAQQYANDNEIIFLETSAKTSLNVRNLFIEIGEYFVHSTVIISIEMHRSTLSAFFLSAAKKLPKVPVISERESFPIVPPKKDKSGCC